ncbi:MAG: hypothetical protein WC121_13865 [Candidatus Kapaibacterium sp.]|jgi:hypothetical protein
MSDELNTWYLLLGAALSAMLITSETLAWIKSCPANAITQLHRCLYCIKSEESDEVPLENRVDTG